MEATSILLVIDAQEGFRTPHTAKVIPAIADAIRSHIGPVIFTRFVNHHGSNFERVLGYSQMTEGLSIELLRELQPLVRSSPVFDKRGYSAFSSAEFCEHVFRLGVKTLKLCGFETDACILATAFGAFDAGYRPVFLLDACSSRAGEEFHDASVKIMSRNLGGASCIFT